MLDMSCKICFEKYNDSSRRPESLVPCGHTICKQCISDLFKTTLTRECPTCRRYFKTSVTNWDLIPDDNVAKRQQTERQKLLSDTKQQLDAELSAYENKRKQNKNDHPDMTRQLSSIASLYSTLGKHAKAIEFFTKSLDMKKRLYNDNHPDIADTMHSIGTCYFQLGEYQKSLDFYYKSLAIRNKILPSTHPDISKSLNDIAISLFNLGQYGVSLQYYQKLYTTSRSVYKGDNVDTASALYAIGHVYAKLENLHGALEFYEKSLNMRQKCLSADDPDLLKSIESVNLVNALLKKQKIFSYITKFVFIFVLCLIYVVLWRPFS